MDNAIKTNISRKSNKAVSVLPALDALLHERGAGLAGDHAVARPEEDGRRHRLRVHLTSSFNINQSLFHIR